MRLRNKLITVMSVVFLFVLASSAFGCACCVDPGYYEISTSKPDTYILGELENLKFDTVTNVYMSDAGYDITRGLEDLEKDETAGGAVDLSLVASFLNKTWSFQINTSTGREAKFTFPMPSSMVRYKADIHDTEEGRETMLYKELRFKGPVRSVSGFLKKSIVNPSTSYFLVLQGRGNGCDSSADFTHWRLELDGPKARYAFYGKLVQP